jgi:hypothetical protein
MADGKKGKTGSEGNFRYRFDVLTAAFTLPSIARPFQPASKWNDLVYALFLFRLAA